MLLPPGEFELVETITYPTRLSKTYISDDLDILRKIYATDDLVMVKAMITAKDFDKSCDLSESYWLACPSGFKTMKSYHAALPCPPFCTHKDRRCDGHSGLFVLETLTFYIP